MSGLGLLADRRELRIQRLLHLRQLVRCKINKSFKATEIALRNHQKKKKCEKLNWMELTLTGILRTFCFVRGGFGLLHGLLLCHDLLPVRTVPDSHTTQARMHASQSTHLYALLENRVNSSAFC